MVTSPWFAAILAFVAVALGTLTVAVTAEMLAASRRRKDVLARLNASDAFVADEHVRGEAAQIFRERHLRGKSGPEWLGNLPHLRDVALMLEQAGLSWSLQSYLFLVLGLTVGIGTMALIVSQSLTTAVIAAAIASILPYLFVRSKRSRRIAKFEEQFPEAIDLLGRAIRAGHPLSAGIRMVSEDGPMPVASEFRQVFEEQRFGLAFDDALLGIADRVDLVDVRILVTAILIQREVGGNLAEILDKISQTIRARFAIRRQLRTYTAQGRMSGYVLAALPPVLATAIFALDPSYVMLLFEEPIGRMMVVTALVLQIFGVFWIRKVVDIEI
jgi:tight adherence protein B